MGDLDTIRERIARYDKLFGPSGVAWLRDLRTLLAEVGECRAAIQGPSSAEAPANPQPTQGEHR